MTERVVAARPLLDAGLGIGLALIYAAGVVLHLLPSTSPSVGGLTPGVLLLTAALTCVPLIVERAGGVFTWILGAYVVGFAAEVTGVATGLVFGSYAYGSVLGPKVLAVPLIIGLNWAFVILGTVTLSVRLLPQPVVAAVVAGALTTGFDWVMEPVAVALGYWHWAGGSIPLRNYVAWFVISGVLAFFLARRRTPVATWLPTVSIVLQLAFFLALRLSLA